MRMLRTMAILLVWASSLTCPAANYFFRTVNVKDGLVDNFVRDIVCDSYGYMWFSTINGLSRYDGYGFRNYRPLQFGGHSNAISSVKETANSTLWMFCSSQIFTYHRTSDTWQEDGKEILARLGMEGTVKQFHVDEKHDIWAVTEMGLYHYDYAQRRLRHFSNYDRSPISHIVSKNGTVIVVTTDNMIYEANHNGKLIPITQAPTLTHSRDSRVYLDNQMNLWLYDSHSLAGNQWIFSLKSHQWWQPSELTGMGNVRINLIAEDNNGRLWVGTGDAGIHVFAYHDGGTSLSEVMNMNAFMTHNSHISSFYLDNNNTMWIGSSKLGVAFTDMSCPNFNLIPTDNYEDVSSLIEDKHGNLWIAFDGDGIMMRSATGTVSHFSALRQQIPSDLVTSLTIYEDGSILAGTYGNGIARYDKARFSPFHPDDPNLKYVKAMTTDSHGNLWVATVDKGVVRVGNDGRIVNFTSKNSLLESNGTLCLACDSLYDIIYIGTSTGVSIYDCATERFIKDDKLEELKGSYATSLLVCNQDILYIGCRDGLWIYHRKDSEAIHLTTHDGLSHNNIRALAKSGDCVWASTDNGLTCILSQDTEDGQTSYKCYPFFESDGLHDAIFSNNAALTMSDGRALLGCFTGYVSISPNYFMTHYPKLQVLFTDCLINGERPSAKGKDSVTDPLQSPKGIIVRHNDHLSISVSAMIPALSRKVKYLYRFKGEKEWMNTAGNNLYFASLHPGSHVLQVKAELPGMTESRIAELPIKVRPPLWLSIPAILFYLLTLSVAFYFLNRFVRRRQQRELTIKQMEINLKQYEMEEEKIRFFTNISHDLKTPLTLVVAPLEKIRSLNLPSPIRTEVDVAWRNARQLYDLILQLLDFRRLDVGTEKLTLKHGDIVELVRQTVQCFDFYATSKQVKSELILPATAVEIDYDENKISRIVTNLLSNAYKYNVDKGMVTVSLDVNGEIGQRQMVLTVADTGIGVKEKQHIFDRFVQETHGQEQEGNGLGLHIVKQYVDMMNGSISVTDNHPMGTIFTVRIPVTESTADVLVENTATEPTTPIEKETTDDGYQDRPTLLVVEDNVDARQFLQRSLDNEYRVLVAANGKEALKLLRQNGNVSIVVSDVMMPEMDGLELFKRMKNNINYCHIPVILLTAKSSEENIVTGLKEGVADYITKPFSLTVLRLRIQKIIEWTQKVQNSVAKGIEIKPSEITVSSLDEEFISHAIADIEANINDMDYSVVRLSDAVGMTRGHLYKKLMAITGKSPLEFIRIIRIKRGKSLLKQGKTNISDVANMVGLSPKQFSLYFKEMYGELPSEYLKKLKNNQDLT